MSERPTNLLLALICLLFIGLSVCGISWGLPSRDIDPYLFGGAEPWSGEKIYRLAGASAKFDRRRGADVDADPAMASFAEPVLLTGSQEDVARIYLRYRLYTYQPDEMIVMMALAGMNPRKLDFDPRLYQYGGLFIYPVGALIYSAKLLGLIDVRSDVVYYLDHPGEFGKFYVVARAYAAAWGVLGLLIVYGIGRRLAGIRAGLLAALLFALLPVVICMAHEGKPHLPGAVLMLAAVFFAMRHVDGPATTQATETNLNWWLMCACCGASFAMVLSSWPIFALIPATALITNQASAHSSAADPSRTIPSRTIPSRAREEADPCAHPDTAIPPHAIPSRDRKGADHGRHAEHTVARGHWTRRTVCGIALALAVYLVTNPYIVINAFTNRQVLASNFGNSLAMYRVDRIGEGFRRVTDLTVEGATLVIAILGTIALIGALRSRMSAAIVLAIPALLFFCQFVLIGAGKPAEYGRFGVFPDAAAAIGTACLVFGGRQSRWSWPRRLAVLLVAGLVGWHGLGYLRNFRIDAGNDNSRIQLAVAMARWEESGAPADYAVGLLADPAPYGCPPMDFANRNVFLLSHPDQRLAQQPDQTCVLIRPVDQPAHRTARTIGQSMPPSEGLEGFMGSDPGEPPITATWPGPTPISWANKPFFVRTGCGGSSTSLSGDR